MNSKHFIKIIIGIVIWTFSPFSSAQALLTEVNKIKDYTQRSQMLYEVPGMAVVIVKNGEVILAEGFGVRDVIDSTRFDKETLFPMASTTKAFTAMAMAILVERDSLTWQTKVRSILPYFELEDTYVTHEITVKDLFTHNAGLTNTDLLWTLWDHSKKEIVERLKYANLDYGLRDGYRYQNVMYMIAGMVIEKISGESWGDFINKEILDPIGMLNTCPTQSCARQYQNRSSPHAPSVKDNKLIRIIDSAADTIDAAGSMWTTAEDMSKWLQFLLDTCKVGNRQIVSMNNYEFVTAPHRWIPRDDFYTSGQLTKPNFMAYGLGWYMHDYHGEKALFHTGSLNGAKAIAGFIPERDLGVYIFTNRENCELRHALMYYIFDALSNRQTRDWSLEIKELYDKRYKARENYRKVLADQRKINTEPSFDLKEYIGEYENPLLGRLKVESHPEGLRIRTREDRHLILTHWHYNTFYAVIEEYAAFENGSLVDFDIDKHLNIELDLFGHIFRKIK